MRIMLIGPQGSGKGTQAKKLADHFQIPHISPGSLFRLNEAQGTALGAKASQYINRGQLVPDEITNAMVADRLRQSDAQAGFVLDGYPRNVIQADALDAVTPIDAVVEITLDDAASIARLAERRECAHGHIYHLTYHPPQQPGRCDQDGEPLRQRADDQPEAIRKRLGIYRTETEPLLERYRAVTKVIRVDGNRSIPEVTADVFRGLGLS